MLLRAHTITHRTLFYQMIPALSTQNILNLIIVEKTPFLRLKWRISGPNAGALAAMGDELVNRKMNMSPYK